MNFGLFCKMALDEPLYAVFKLISCSSKDHCHQAFHLCGELQPVLQPVLQPERGTANRKHRDSVGAVAGAMAGLYYSRENDGNWLPKDLLDDLQGKDLLNTAVEKLSKTYVVTE